MKTRTITEKIPRSTTGLNGSLFVHVSFDATGQVCEIEFSEKGKDGSNMDHILAALGSVTTSIINAGP